MDTVDQQLMYEWKDLPWRNIQRRVFKLQKRIYKASGRGDVKTVHRLQKLLMKSWSAKCLATRRVTQDNQGKKTAGIDGVKSLLPTERLELARRLKPTLKPKPVRRVWIPKPGTTEKRGLGIPTIRDRVVQMLLKMLLEPIFESDFLDCSTGFRPNRRTMDAIAVCYQLINPRNSYFYVIEGDIRSCFDKVNHDILLKLISRRIADQKILNLIGRFLKANIMEGQVFRRSTEGTPQGGILSPLLANVYLHELDKWWYEKYGSIERHAKEKRRKQGQSNCIYVRYTDDWIALCNGTKAQAEAIKDEIRAFLHDELKLELSEEKTAITHANDGFDFLGFHIQHQPAHNGRKAITLVTPSEKSIARLKDKIRDMTDRKGFADNPMFKFGALNMVLRGWINYYRHVNVSQLASWLDHWVHLRVAKWLVKRHKSSYREILKDYLVQQETRKNFAVKRSDGSDLFLFMMKDIHITPYKRKTVTNPYIDTDHIQKTAPANPEIPVEDNPWNGRSELSEWRNTRDGILQRDNYRCQDCGSTVNLDVHHILEQWKGGKDTPENLVTLCEDCHVKRGNYGKPRKERVMKAG